MTDMPAPRRLRRWWIVPLVGLLLLTAGALAYRATHLEQWSWFWASRDLEGWDIGATGEDDIYVVGNLILHYDGNRWHRMDYGATDRLMPEIREESPSFLGLFELPDVWGWLPPDFYDVEVYDAAHIYAGGAAGVYQSDGKSWSQMPLQDGLDLRPYDIWVRNPDDIYAVDGESGLFEWDGQAWRLESQDVIVNRLHERWHLRLVGGNDDTVIAVGDGLMLQLNSGDGWQQINIAPLVEDIVLDERASESYGLQLNGVWALQDGRILIGVWEEEWLTPYLLHNCRRLLCYEDGVWQTIPTPDYWHPWEILIDSHGNLASINKYGQRYQYVQTDSETGPVWQLVEEEMDRNWGAFSLLDNTNLFLYGGELYVNQASTDPLVSVTIPCSVERYELTW